MKSDTRLNSALFQLTPTRTRCDLVISANGKTEKLASGLLNPFLAHLKTAQDQIAQGGYSITLEPDPRSDISWFTKGTIERFVRFVSTPEVLERVNTIESEILQIDEAIAIQNIDNLGLSTQMDDHQMRSTESSEGGKPVADANVEKAVVLFKPGVHPPESNGSTAPESNSKVQLLRVLEARRAALQKEQGMAFARAVAAGFDMDQMTHLISFAECFGATRLMDACLRYMELWKQKHETGQWLEIEAAEAMSSRSDFSAINASGIMFSGEVMKQKEVGEGWPQSHGELDAGSNEKDERSPMGSHVPLGPHEYFHGNFQHPVYPQWPIHSMPGAPVFQAYPPQGIPYYQNYAGSAPFFQPLYPPVEDPGANASQRMGQKRHSMGSKDSNIESETFQMDISNARMEDDADQNTSESEEEGLQVQTPQKKVGRSGKKRAGMVVIRNINYITSKGHSSSGSESESALVSEVNEETEDLQSDVPERNHKYSKRSSKSKASHKKLTNTRSLNDGDVEIHGRESDGGNWEVFQNFLLRDDEEGKSSADRSMFSAEKEAPVKRRQGEMEEDPILPSERDLGAVANQRMSEFGDMTIRMHKQRAGNDDLAISSEGFQPNRGGLRDSQMDVQYTEMERRGGTYRRANDDYMIYQQGKEFSTINSYSDPLVGSESQHADNSKKSSQTLADESFIVPFRSSSHDQVEAESRAAIDMDAEIPSSLQRTEDSSNRNRSEFSYEPEDLSLIPERRAEREFIGYDAAIDYEMQAHAENPVMLENGKHEDLTSIKEGSKTGTDKKSKVPDTLEKRKMEAALRKAKPTRLSPLADAKERAERLRAFKADIQKIKKEKEEEAIQRLEALKRERQKRIAARGGSSPKVPPQPSQQAKSRLPTKLSPALKLSPASNKGSGIDTETMSSLPIKKLSSRTDSVGSSGSQKTVKPGSRLNGVNGDERRLNRSLTSLSELKEEKADPMHEDTELRKPSIQTRRLSDPKGGNSHQASLKARSSDMVPKSRVSDASETRKVSAITSHDRIKSEARPESNIRTLKGNVDTAQNKTLTNRAVQKGNSSKSSIISGSSKLKRSSEKTSHQSDDNPVIEKTVVMLEHKMPAVPVGQASEEKVEDKKRLYGDDSDDKSEVVSEDVVIHPPASPIIVGDQESSEFLLEPKSLEVTIDYSGAEMQKASSITVTEKTYNAPYARNLSLEDPCTHNSEFSKASPVDSELATSTETIKVQISDFTDPNFPEQTSEAVEKPRGRESTKGFKRLLKFGRKNTIERNTDSDSLSIDGSTVQDHIAAAVPNEVSRSFSLLSPFRSKTSEKKV